MKAGYKITTERHNPLNTSVLVSNYHELNEVHHLPCCEKTIEVCKDIPNVVGVWRTKKRRDVQA